MRAARSKVWTAEKKGIFFEIVRRTGNISAAARAVNIPRRAVYEYRRNDEKFGQALDAAREEALDELEGELWRRAVKGVERPVYYGGQQCGAIRSYSDRLGMYLLNSRRQEVSCESAELNRTAMRADIGTALSAREKLVRRLEAMSDGASIHKRPEQLNAPKA